MNDSATTGFDTTFRTTNTWIAELAANLGWEDRHHAYMALRAVLHAVRERLGVDAVAAFGAQLPMLVRGFYYDGWHPAGKPTNKRKLDDFLRDVAEEMHLNGRNDERQVAQEVFRLLKKHLTNGEIRALQAALPGSLQELWG
jgi:uncharacterized protein (DUF2267 family)